MTTIARFLTAYAVAAVLLALAGGCGGDKASGGDSADGSRPGEAFYREGETPEVTRMNQEQIAAGARTDATLRPYHFHEAELNSLGLEKLDHMVGGAPRTGALVVYLDVPSDGDEKALASARRKAVTEYLSGRGLAEHSFRLESGHNPRATVPVRSLQRETDVVDPAPEAPPTGFGSSGGGSGQPTK
jgi:hypothetical protein